MSTQQGSALPWGNKGVWKDLWLFNVFAWVTTLLRYARLAKLTGVRSLAGGDMPWEGTGPGPSSTQPSSHNSWYAGQWININILNEYGWQEIDSWRARHVFPDLTPSNLAINFGWRGFGILAGPVYRIHQNPGRRYFVFGVQAAPEKSGSEQWEW